MSEPELVARKATTYLPVSCCVLTDTTGVNHCDHPQPPPPPWARRLRWRLAERWRTLRRRLGSWVAGVNLDRECDE